MATVLGAGEPTAEEVRAAGARAVVTSLARLHLAPRDVAVYAVTGPLEVHRIDRGALDRLAGARAFVATAAEAATLTGEDDPEAAARQLAARGPRAVLTMGADGALEARGGDVRRARAPTVDVVDATGAGDVFVAAYVWADVRGVGGALSWAVLHAALSVRAPTAFAGAVGLPELIAEGRAWGLDAP